MKGWIRSYISTWTIIVHKYILNTTWKLQKERSENIFEIENQSIKWFFWRRHKVSQNLNSVNSKIWNRQPELSRHHTTPHHTKHCTALHYTTPHKTLHHTTLHHTTPHKTLHRTTPHHTTQNTAPHYTTTDNRCGLWPGRNKQFNMFHCETLNCIITQQSFHWYQVYKTASPKIYLFIDNILI